MKKNIYVCGPTVYDTPHIGNMRPALTFDFYVRAHKYLGNDVNYIHNITDIDDKIIQRAYEQDVPEQELVNRHISEYNELFLNFNMLSPTHMPRVSDNIKEIIAYIKSLVDNENAYESNGSVYFDVTTDSKYGSLSNREIEEGVFEGKRNKSDFALWKKTDKGLSFESPWSQGRPGWHTECALFVDKFNNSNTLDIHGGGIDLLFPHHENEASQFRVLNNVEIAKEWKRLGKVLVNNEKMSKSLNNDYKADEWIENIGADVLRLIFLTTSPTGHININEQLIKQNVKQIEKIRKTFIKAQINKDDLNDVSNEAKLLTEFKLSAFSKTFNESMKKVNKNEGHNSHFVELVKLIGFNMSKIMLTNGKIKIYKEIEKHRSNGEFDKADELKKQL
ncbi:MAG: class I tRNA ligase family protein [Mycoplasmataceae bacterium]|nr:class I tRNA ligase family protein [Mycoplasmataceae bacterium]